jgi:hypothetical protein
MDGIQCEAFQSVQNRKSFPNLVSSIDTPKTAQVTVLNSEGYMPSLLQKNAIQ